MPDLPANVIEFDVNRFVAAVLNRAQGGPESGAFIFDGDQISIVSRAAKAFGRYDAAFEFPDDNNDDAPAVAAVFMHHKRLNMGNIVVYFWDIRLGLGSFPGQHIVRVPEKHIQAFILMTSQASLLVEVKSEKPLPNLVSECWII